MDTTPAPMVVDSPPTRDFYTLAEHQCMDLQVQEKLQSKKTVWRKDASLTDFEGVLSAVIRSDDRLDRKYLSAEFHEFPSDVQERLHSAWKVMEFQSIRILCSLQAPETKASIGFPPAPEYDIRADLATAMTQSYEGSSVKAFIHYLTFNDIAYRLPGMAYYGRFCSITQSSGTGKTRLLLELGKTDICVLYMNIRSKEDKGYPPRDDIPANILTPLTPLSEEEYAFQCRVFFATVFKRLGAFLEETNTCRVLSDPGDDKRTRFFEGVREDLGNVAQEMHQSSSDAVMKKYLKAMVNAKCFLHTDKNHPRVVIAIDESHVLHEKLKSEYLQATVLLRTIKAFSGDETVWVVFASTVSRVADFASPQAVFPSARVSVEGEMHFHPFTQLGWDQHAPALKDVELDKVAWDSHLLRYGRPLWWSLKHHGVQEIVKLAQQKLCSSATFNLHDVHQAFAVLAQRFGLEIALGHRQAVKYNDELIASHLCICIKTTEDRAWSYTTYPSEPIVSVAAARLLHSNEEHLNHGLSTVFSLVSNGLLNAGDSGELASRFIWLLAKDICVHKGFTLPCISDAELPECQLVPVVRFLEVVFGSEVTKQAPGIMMTFKEAYINFTHWIQMKFDIVRGEGGEQNDASIEEWTESLWARTSAVQCCHNQPAIDKVIPMYFKSEPRENAMSHILISDKAHDKPQLNTLNNITRRSITPSHYSGPPYIVIRADLGVKDPCLFVCDDCGEGSKDQCLRIYAAGLGNQTYPFLVPKIVEHLKDLYSRYNLPPEYKELEGLEDQVQFGLSRERRYLNLKE